eukprot:TRINITY_DN1177_c0_g1_i1.p1 TRINITY_DN1177_c0_g1~~TRINITY_DN1177_c0_g1_i1.p1  ORF type:complete len:263 (+),score=64.33 TRINITY_DN1177_c0_g1_i1:91-879(+)
MCIRDRFQGMNNEQLKSFLGTKLQPFQNVPKVSYSHLLQYTKIPESFDSRERWGKLIHPVRDQARCGSCWAFGASEAFSDRLAIASEGKIDVVLSPQYSVSCDDNNMGCNGGYLEQAWEFFQYKGIPSDECVPYTSDKGDVEDCPKECKDGSKIELYRTKNIRTYDTIEDAKLDILTNGPIETGFMVYQDFMTYSSGIYKHVHGQFLGGHAVKIIGWGVEKGINYWIVVNSWGESWGENGLFRIQERECQFESQLIAGDAVV